MFSILIAYRFFWFLTGAGGGTLSLVRKLFLLVTDIALRGVFVAVREGSNDIYSLGKSQVMKDLFDTAFSSSPYRKDRS